MKESFVKKRKKELIVAGVALIVILGVSFAWLTQTLSSNNTNVIVAGKLQLTLNNEDPILKLGGTYGYGEPLSDASGLQTTPYTFTITNTGTEEAYYNLYIDDVSSYKDRNNNTVNITSGTRISDTKIDYNLKVGNSDTNSTVATLSSLGNPRELVTGATLAAGASVTYSLRLWIDSSAVNSDVVGKVFAGKLRIEATQASRYASNINSHIKAVYEYNENGSGTGASYTGCLGGSEAGCVDVLSSKTSSSTYAVGTVIKYEVKDGTEKYFNVLHDDGSTLTLQERQNTVDNVYWYGTSGTGNYTNANGPDYTNSGYALYELEHATADWTYVNDQTYSIGDNTTTLGYSGCSADNNCSTATYTLTRNNKKARMITVQELIALNCSSSPISCKPFVYNYLHGSVGPTTALAAYGYGHGFLISYDTDTNAYYLTMSAASGNSNAWFVNNYGLISKTDVYSPNPNNWRFGARAVVVIDK